MHPRIALIHAVAVAVDPVNEALRRLWPQAEAMNLLDDSLSIDRAMESALSHDLYRRIESLGDYAVAAQASAVLYTCSAFGPAIERFSARATVPVLKPNEAMFEEALQSGDRIGMLATFPASIESMTAEFEALVRRAGRSSARLESHCIPDAMAALKAGDGERHDRLLGEAASRLSGCDAIMLAQFSTARAKDAVSEATGRSVLTSPDSAIRKLRDLLNVG